MCVCVCVPFFICFSNNNNVYSASFILLRCDTKCTHRRRAQEEARVESERARSREESERAARLERDQRTVAKMRREQAASEQNIAAMQAKVRMSDVVPALMHEL